MIARTNSAVLLAVLSCHLWSAVNQELQGSNSGSSGRNESSVRLTLRLLPLHQSVFEHQAPQLEIEVLNATPNRVDLVHELDTGGLLLVAQRDAQGKRYATRYTAFIQGGQPIFPRPRGVGQDEVFKLEPGQMKRFKIASTPEWNWKEGEYSVTAVLREKIGRVRVTVVRQPLFMSEKLPKEVRYFFNKLYGCPLIEGGSRYVFRKGKMSWRSGTEDTFRKNWIANKPFLVLSKYGKKICEDFRPAVLKALKANIGNYRIRPELFAIAAETNAKEMIPYLIDLLSEYREVLFLMEGDGPYMLGTLEKMMEKLGGRSPPYIFPYAAAFGYRLLWWAQLRRGSCVLSR